MRPKGYFIIGIICTLLFITWMIANANEKMTIYTPAYGEVVIALPNGIPNFGLHVHRIGHMVTSNIGYLQYAYDMRTYQVWIKIYEPIILGLSIYYEPHGGVAYHIYKVAIHHYSGEPTKVDGKAFNDFIYKNNVPPVRGKGV